MKNIPFVDLKAGYYPLKDEILEAISDVLESMQLYIGPNVTALEDEFAAYIGTKYAVGVGSGTEALLIALAACGIKKGDEVITTPHTFFATAEAIYHAGATPVFVDIDPDTYNINPRLIKEKITNNTRAIIPVHMYGQTADMMPIVEIAKAHNLHIVEDACQAHGAQYDGKNCGQFGAAGCFSFYYTKNLGAYGEGGIITTNDVFLADTARKLRNHGHSSKFEHSLMGHNSRLDELQAAILRIRLRHLDEYNNLRRKIAKMYDEMLSGLPLRLPAEKLGNKHVYHLYVIRCKERDELIKHLTQCGISSGIHYKNPVHLQEACKPYGYKAGDLPVTEAICGEILSLPMYPELAKSDIAYVCECIREFYKM
ncbi:MAG: DegT/DnrJ/EryC1/StrS family aminotransferase [Candidatus Magnetoovum sp. WYHC-5]|nr:DegT/DnrJ/EryC1/StrS family aminotransferase [Candidatus Magnetoovum sp. WYHC-5]